MKETPVICTITTQSHLSQARCLTKSFLEHHPDGVVFVLLLDVMGYYLDPSIDKFTTVLVEYLEIAQYESMLQKYSERDLAISLKPFLLQYILEKYDYTKVCWFDSDIYIYSSLKESVWDKLDDYPIILTPHLLQPLDKYDLPRELCVAVAGIYNSGFIGLCKHEDSNKFIEWWKTRLKDACFSNPGGGLTRDQRWLDFLPTLGLNIHISRDPGLNVGHWDLHNRWIDKSEWGYSVNGFPLKFFHFSGYSYKEPEVISKHLQSLTLEDRHDLKPIFDIYQNSLVYFNTKEENVNKMLMNQLKVTEIESALSKAQDELEIIKCQLQQTQSELTQKDSNWQQAMSQLQETQLLLEQSQSQLQATQGELQQSQSQLQATQGELQQSQSQLQATQGELQQSQSQLQATQGELEQIKSVQRQTQGEFSQTKSLQRQTQRELSQSNSQLHQTQTELKQSQSQLHQTQAELSQYQLQLHKIKGELKRSQSQFYLNLTELEKYQSQLHQAQQELQQSQPQLHQIQQELQQSQSQLHLMRRELKETQFQLHQTLLEFEQSQAQLHQREATWEQSQAQLHQAQGELERWLRQQAIATEVNGEFPMHYKLLVWEAWFAYNHGEMTKTAQCLQETFKSTPLSRTETVINWLELFAKFSLEKGEPFDSHLLTNSEEWKRLIHQVVAVKHKIMVKT